MLTEARDLDPISLEILHNALRSVTDESYVALMKSAYSTNIKERHDHTSVLVDAQGRSIVQAGRALPGHLGSMFGLVDSVYRNWPADQIKPGDVLITNDPYEGGSTHLPDVNVIAPVFVDQRLVAFVCNIAHHADIGGMAPGSMSGRMSDIHQEGLRIPPVKLMRAGKMCRDIMNMLLSNVRVPEERRGDFYAQIAACRLGVRRMLEVAENYSAEVLEAAFDQYIARTERRIRERMKAIPPGTYTFEDVMDDDGFGAKDIPLKLSVRVDASHKLTFDFTGSAQQVQGNINCTLAATLATVGYAIKALLGSDIPSNDGIFKAFDLVTELGSIVHAQFPAAVANRAQTSQRIADMVVGALAPALPGSATAASHGTTVLLGFSGTDPRNNNKPFVYFEVIAGGGGARATKDGKDGIMVHVTNTSNMPVEAIELEFPLLVESYGLVQDSGGAGTFNGGLGIRRVVRPLTDDCLFEGNGERFNNRPWGIFGGGDAKTGRFEMRDDNGTTRALEIKAAGIPVGRQQRLFVDAPGGGGYGPPENRDLENLNADFRGGRFSENFLRKTFNFTPSKQIL
jgi:N-methylhydantoinase B